MKDKDTLKIVYVPPPILFTLLSKDETLNTSDSTLDQSTEDDARSSVSQDTVIISPSERQEPWPAVFPVPTFSLPTEMLLATANEEFLLHSYLDFVVNP